MAMRDFPEEEELVLCTVTKIMGTTVFVKVEDYNKEGVVATSEVAPGRIRNIRDYVTINKKIVCKVLRVDREKGHIDMSLRRVSQKDTRKILEEYKQETAALLILKIVLKDNANQVAERIKEKYNSLTEFLDKVKANSSLLDEFVEKNESKSIQDLLKERIKEKKFQLKAVISMSTASPNGISAIKSALLAAKDVKISYLGAPNYSVIAESKDPKDAEKKLKDAIDTITEKIKSSGGKIEVKEED
jgi:translation initiation factor 2 subunit 1